METIFQDVKFGSRMLAKTPGFTIVALLTLALGIGANTAIFSVVDSVLLRPLPFEEPESLVIVGEVAEGARGISVALPNYFDWREQNQVFADMAAYNQRGVVMQSREGAERLSASVVTARFLPALGVPVAHGRGFSEEDERTASAVVVLSDGFWKRRFGGDASVLNTQLTIDGRPYTVIGVLPPTFRTDFLTSALPDVLLPFAVVIAADPENWLKRTNHAGTSVLARLRPGVSVEQARTELTAIAARLEKQYPDTNAGLSVNVRPMLQVVTGEVRPALLILLAASAILLLIACTNLANLQLTRGTSRAREIAVKLALGAPRIRLVRQLITESVMLSLIGGGLGILLAPWSVELIVQAAPRDIPRLDMANVDARVLAFTAVVAVLTGILFGVLPAWQALSLRANELLKETVRSVGAARSGQQARNVLVVTEVALSLLLLLSAGLLLRSFLSLRAVDPGFDPVNVLTFRIWPPDERYPDADRRLQFYDAALQRVRALPGVEAVAAITPLPFSGSHWQHVYRAEGEPLPKNRQFPSTEVHFVSPDYFRAMRIPLLRGRMLADSDRRGAQSVVVINRTMAERLWPGQDPLGRRIRTGAPPDLVSADEEAHPWWTVVGVVGDVRRYGLDVAPKTELYFPLSQNPVYVQTFVLRASGPAAALAQPVRRAVNEFESQAPVFRFVPMEEMVAASLAPRRLLLALMGAFAGLAVLLAAVGLYGVISYVVAQRTPEIGVRMALGAQRAHILRMVLGQSARLMAAGIGLGLLCSLFATLALRTQLFGVGRLDLATIAGVAGLLCAVALLASYIPARRAAAVNPLEALRYE